MRLPTHPQSNLSKVAAFLLFNKGDALQTAAGRESEPRRSITLSPFVASQIKDGLSSQYYITGRAGEPKRIILNRSLVEDKSGMIMR